MSNRTDTERVRSTRSLLGRLLALWSAATLEKVGEVRVDGLAVDPHVLPSGDALAAGFGPELRVLSLVGG